MRNVGTAITSVGTVVLAVGGCEPEWPANDSGAARVEFTSHACGSTSADSFSIPIGEEPTTNRTLGRRVSTGEYDAEVACAVQQEGDGYWISAVLRQPPYSFLVVGTVESREDERYEGNAEVRLVTPGTGELWSDEGACTLTVSEQQDVSRGRVWGSYRCLVYSPGGDADLSCAIEGDFVFEGCDI